MLGELTQPIGYGHTSTALWEARSAMENVPAVVIGAELNGLSICRSLGEEDIPSFIIDRKLRNPGMWSRHARPVKVSAMRGQEFIDSLLRLQRRLGQQPVLIVTDEMSLLTISEFRDQLAGYYRFHLPPHETVMMLHDKALFHEFAVANDLPVPNGAVIRQITDLTKLDLIRYPAIIKPADKRHYHLQGVPRLIRVENREAAAVACRKLLASASQIIVQECIEGPDTDIYFCLFYQGVTASAMFCGRKLASEPPGMGSTAFCTSSPTQFLIEAAHEFIERVGYLGFGGIEYKWDAVTKRYVIIEPTVGRTDWQEEIATLAGVNIPLTGYYDECGMRYVPHEQIEGVVWQGSYIDRLKVGSAVVPKNAIVTDGYWRRNDPLPALIFYPIATTLSLPSIASALVQRHLRRYNATPRRPSNTVAENE